MPRDRPAPRAARLVSELGWEVTPESPALRHLEQALEALDDVGQPAHDDSLALYARLVEMIGDLEVNSVPRTSAQEAAVAVIIGTVLWEPVLLALRRLAQEAISARTIGQG